MTGGTVHMWLAMDRYPFPEGGQKLRDRIMAQPEPWDEHSFPPGNRGTMFEFRETDLTGEQADTWRRLLAAELTPGEQDSFHHELWAQAVAS